MPALSESEIAAELAAFDVTLPPPALAQLSRYLELLLQWNRRINLTGLRQPETIVRRLFGESLRIARAVELRGRLVDIGSGAGFPGLALKLAAPDLRVTLIEARQKKCAFLKEVVRQCGFTRVEVVAERFEDWARQAGASPDIITTRAVGVDSRLLRSVKELLAPGGKIVFMTTVELARRIQAEYGDWHWAIVPCSSSGANSILAVGTPL